MQSPKRNVARSLASATAAAVIIAGLLYFTGRLTSRSIWVALPVAIIIGIETLYSRPGGSIPQGPRVPLPKDPPPPEPEEPPLPRWRD